MNWDRQIECSSGPRDQGLTKLCTLLSTLSDNLRRIFQYQIVRLGAKELGGSFGLFPLFPIILSRAGCGLRARPDEESEVSLRKRATVKGASAQIFVKSTGVENEGVMKNAQGYAQLIADKEMRVRADWRVSASGLEMCGIRGEEGRKGPEGRDVDCGHVRLEDGLSRLKAGVPGAGPKFKRRKLAAARLGSDGCGRKNNVMGNRRRSRRLRRAQSSRNTPYHGWASADGMLDKGAGAQIFVKSTGVENEGVMKNAQGYAQLIADKEMRGRADWRASANGLGGGGPRGLEVGKGLKGPKGRDFDCGHVGFEDGLEPVLNFLQK